MTGWTLFAALVSVCALLPPVLAVRLACDRLEDASFRAVVRDVRFAAALLGSLLAECAMLELLTGSASPVRFCAGVFRRTITFQMFSRGCAGLLLGILCAVAVGDGIRAAACSVHRAYPNLPLGAFLRGVLKRRKTKFKRRAAPEAASGRCRSMTLLTCAVLSLVLLAGVGFGAEGARHLHIQEVCRKHQGIDADESYFVLRNDGVLPCETQGLYLSTDENALNQYAAGVTVPAQGEAQETTQDAEFVQMRREGGSTLYLSDRFGKVLDSAVLPALEPDMVCTRTSDGWELRSLVSAQAEQTVSAPVFSAPGGFYDEAFSLSLSADDGCVVYYTLDCSEPTPESTPYRDPIRVRDRSAEPNVWRAVQNVQRGYLDKDPIGGKPVAKAFVVRAVAQNADGVLSPVVTQTYFVGQEKYQGDAVVSLVADPDALFGQDGIYVTGTAYDEWYAAKRSAEQSGADFNQPEPTPNFKQRGTAWERPGNVELFESTQSVLNQRVGIRMQGDAGANEVLKRFAVYARKVYQGGSLFQAQIFDGYDTHSFFLRPGVANAISCTLLNGRSVGALPLREVTVFVDGEFWYVTYLQEKICNANLASYFGVLKNNIEFVDIGSWSRLDETGKALYRELLNFVESLDLSEPADYETLLQHVDLQSYIDYVCCNVYLANEDFGEQKNVCVWRAIVPEGNEFGDGRWRWLVNDMDLIHESALRRYGFTNAAEINTFREKDWKSDNTSPLLTDSVFWSGLRRSETFNRQFVLSFMDIVNTTFAPEHVEQVLASFGEDLDYDGGFFRERNGYVTGYLAEEFGLTGTLETLLLHCDAPDGGVVMVNSCAPDLSGGSWSGQYFTDYPVTLTAVPAEGRSFVGWRVDGELIEQDTLELTLAKGGVEVYAIFA